MSSLSQSSIQVNSETNSPRQALAGLPSDITIFVKEQPIHTIWNINQAIIKDISSTCSTCHIFQALKNTLDQENKVCLSPRTTLSALFNPTVTLQDAKDIAVSLANTAESRHVDFAHQANLYATAVDRLERELDAKRAVPVKPPYRFVPNDNRAPYFVIHNSDCQRWRGAHCPDRVDAPPDRVDAVTGKRWLGRRRKEEDKVRLLFSATPY